MAHAPETPNFDVILIGSGMGALTVASLLAQVKKQRVLILERHFKPGGFTHTFKRGKFLWDVGLHYVGEIEGGTMGRLFDMITRSQVKWQAMPDIFEKFVYPGLTFEVPSNPERYLGRLIEHFPSEKQALQSYFTDMAKVTDWMRNHFIGLSLPSPLGRLLRLKNSWEEAMALQTTQTYMDSHFRDDRLKGLLVSQWGDYGLPPAQSALGVHAMVVCHYLKGGFYPIGGSGTIAEAVQPIVAAAGGQVLLCHEVKQILLAGDQAIGVRVTDRRDRRRPVERNFYAPVIVSDAGAWNTYLNLLPPDGAVPFQDSLRRFGAQHPTATALSVYIGFKGDPSALGFRGENHWIYPSFDHNANFAGRRGWMEGPAPPPLVYLSFPSLKDPAAQAHTAEIITMADYPDFAPWKDRAWKKRGADYQAFKDQLTSKLIGYVDSLYPGFADLVEYRELSTPLSNEHFTGHPGGAIYGLPAVPDRFRLERTPWHQPESPIRGLYLTGADVGSLGIGGAIGGGLITTSKLLDLPTVGKMMRQLGL